MGSFYQNWGFTDQLFSAMPLVGDTIGNHLLVGRDTELRSLLFRLRAGGEAVCLDGQVGVGKTSLANVAAYRAELEHFENPKDVPLILPCRKPFQISKDETPEELKFKILSEVAQTLIEKASNVNRGKFSNSYSLNAWLNEPMLRQIEGQLAGFGIGGSMQPNESQGYLQSGFIKQITNWLESIFPDRTTGGVVCIIDNLELLETSAVARRTIEHLRDSLFTMCGIRWVLCGAHGIIHSVVSSARLAGYLGEPLLINKLRVQQAQEVFNTRILAYRDHTKAVQYLPLVENDFHKLYVILGGNLRQTLAYAHSYCLSVAESGSGPEGDDAKRARFELWLKSYALATLKSIQIHVGPTALRLLRDAVKHKNGEFTYGDFAILNFNSVNTVRPHIKSLEDNGLVEVTRDEADQRRQTITTTGKGWLITWLQTVQ
jgi:hypothetical protein